MARLLVVGGGCRALALARELEPEGHALRIVTRSEARRPEIEAVGAECVIGDPDVIGTLRYALDNVTLLLWLLGTASGDPDRVAALHDSRWEMMLWRTIDSTVRGVVYEAAGSVDARALLRGREVGERMARENEIPLRFIEADPADRSAWLRAAHETIAGLLAR
jgi:hypothetical protein